MSLLFPYFPEQALACIQAGSHAVPDRPETDGCVVCAMQVLLKPREGLPSFIDDIEARYQHARSLGARLIVFPELFGLSPLCCAPLTRGWFREKRAASADMRADGSPCTPAELFVPERPHAALPRLVRQLLPLVQGAVQVTDAILSAFSEKYGILTASGSAPSVIGGRLYNVQTLYGADGQVIGRQAKIAPMENELALGVCYAEQIEVFDTEIGRIAIPVCMDASYFEVFRLCYEKGARIVALGTFNLEEYDPYLALRGIRPRCSEYPMYGVKSAMTGFLWGRKATGCAEIDAPCDTVPGGVITQSGNAWGDALVTASLPVNTPFVRDAYRQNFDAPQLRALLDGLYD